MHPIRHRLLGSLVLTASLVLTTGVPTALAAPLIAGNDLSRMSAKTRAIRLNREVIAVDQDALGIQGRRAWKNGDAEIWVKPLSGGSEALVLLDRGTRPQSIRLDWSVLGLPGYLPLQIRDLWCHETLPVAEHSLVFNVAPTSVVMLRATPARPQTASPHGDGPPLRLSCELAWRSQYVRRRVK